MSPFKHQWMVLAALLITSTLSWAQDEPVEQGTQSEAELVTDEQAGSTRPREPGPSLEQAYQREFAFLQGQKSDLERRLSELRGRIKREKSGLQGEIGTLEAEVVQMRGQADRLDDLVFESERAVDSARDNTDLLASTFLQADFTLGEDYSPSHGDQAPQADDVRTLFDAASEMLARYGQVRRAEGEFFLTDGTRVSGDIIYVGRIAAYGLSDRGQGALAPAGDGGLKIWQDEAAAEAADELAAGNRPETLPLFAFESLATEVEKRADKSAIDVVRDGGLIGWIIFWLGVVGALLVVLRLIFLQQASSSTGKVMEAVGGHVKRGDREAALQVLKRKSGSTSRVVASAIRNLDRDREHLEDIVSESILHESSHLNRFGAVILVIAAVSPLLGLLGTVTGMISTFDVITEFGTGDPKLLSGGISIALVTTQLGLIVAIPLLLLGNVLSGWAERIKDDMEKATLRIINQYTEARTSQDAGVA